MFFSSLLPFVTGICCCASIYMLYTYPENGLDVLGYRVPRYIWKILVQTSLFYLTYKTLFPKPATSKPDFVYFSTKETMTAQTVKEYGAEKMDLTTKHPRPKVVHPNDVLVRVHAASVNPIDYLLAKGHARAVFDQGRKAKQLPFGGAELPLVLGRDCSGVVEAVGSGVEKFRVGDEVYLAVGAEYTPGTFAELVLAKESMVARKPRTLSHAQATTIPFVCTTSWRALVDQCGLRPDSTAGKRVLILAGSGGLGSFAIQLVKAWGGHVTTTCSTNAIALVERLGADDVIDYTREDLAEELAKRPKFDVALITLGPAFYEPCLTALKKGGRATTVMVPFFANIKKYGKVRGTLVNEFLKLKWKMQNVLYDRYFTFTFNQPNGRALEEVAKLVDDGKIKPVVDRTFDFGSANEAVEFVKRGHARGKTVITMID